MKRCPCCKKWYEDLNNHHVFYGTGDREVSDKYEECQIDICYWCHESSDGVHGGNYQLDLRLKKQAQRKFEAKYGHDRFMKEFGRDYLSEPDESEVEQPIV